MPTHSRIAFFLTKSLKNPLPGIPKAALALLLLAGLLYAPVIEAQSGGRKKEGKIKRRGDFKLTQYKSRGHADEFARGSSGRKGWIARLFKRDKPAWTYRTTGSSRSNYKENRFLFAWTRSKGRAENASTVDRQNKIRSHNRERGNKTFRFKKHKRKKN